MAERIISARGVPLTGPQIIEFANKHDVLPYGSHETIVKTLQARISEDIAKFRRKSRFLRTGIGTYFLQSLANQPTIYGKIRWTEARSARSKPEHPHRILTVPSDKLTSNYLQTGWETIAKLLEQGSYAYQSEIMPGYVPVATGVSLSWHKKILTYEIGVHTHFEKIVGQRTTILRKFLDEYDLDMFETDGTGATSSTARTILPILTDGRRTRLENGKLTKRERLQFFQVAKLLSLKSALWSEKTGCFVLLSLVDLSNIFPSIPDTKRRLEQNNVKWVNKVDGRNFIDERDSMKFISSLCPIENTIES